MIKNPEKINPEEKPQQKEWNDVKKILEKENTREWFEKKGINIEKMKEKTVEEKKELGEALREAKEIFRKENEEN